MSKVVHILHDDHAQPEVHEHGGHPVHAADRPSRHFPLLAGTAIALFLVIFGLLMWRAASVPDDTKVHAELDRVKREIALRRTAKPRTATVAGVADRIVRAPAGRRAQREWLKNDGDAN